MMIMFVLVQMVEQIVEETDTPKIITKSSCDGADCERRNVLDECMDFCKKMELRTRQP